MKLNLYRVLFFHQKEDCHKGSLKRFEKKNKPLAKLRKQRLQKEITSCSSSTKSNEASAKSLHDIFKEVAHLSYCIEKSIDFQMVNLTKIRTNTFTNVIFMCTFRLLASLLSKEIASCDDICLKQAQHPKY